MTVPASARRPGRPSARHPSARSQILDALTGLLDTTPHAPPSLRAVARAAAVTPALLHYHFVDLAGLLRGLHEERAMPLLRPLLQELQAGESDAGAALARFLQKWTRLGVRHPWLAACLLHIPAVAVPNTSDCSGIVRAAVAAAQRQGSVRPDLPDHYIALLLLSLGVLPHLAQTALVAGSDPPPGDVPDAASLTLLHLALLRSGVASQRPRQESPS